MNYTKEDGRITVFDTEDFFVCHITGCGQLFRFQSTGATTKIFAKNCKCILKQEVDCVILDTNDVDFFENYFDLSTDYAKVRAELARFGLASALDFGKGLRILKQDPIETVFSFIISANNNIPRIQSILGRLCERYGEKIDGGYAFPSVEKLSAATELDLKRLGVGYRAPYIIKTAQAIRLGFDLDLYQVRTEDARKQLMTLSGVGAKVADCILLFAYGKNDVFPVDTWVKKIYRDIIGDNEQNTKKMAETLTSRFGALSGYAQQYLFYYYRNNKASNMTEEIES